MFSCCQKGAKLSKTRESLLARKCHAKKSANRKIAQPNKQKISYDPIFDSSKPGKPLIKAFRAFYNTQLCSYIYLFLRLSDYSTDGSVWRNLVISTEAKCLMQGICDVCAGIRRYISGIIPCLYQVHSSQGVQQLLA